MAKWGEGDPRWIVEERPDATNVNNWHWTEKNANQWSKDKLKELLVGLVIEDANVGKVEVTELTSIDGEAIANNRKAKLIFFYEWVVKGSWKGLVNGGGEEVTGYFEIPNLSEENDLEEIEVEITIGKAPTDNEDGDDKKMQSGPAVDTLKNFMRNKGRDVIRSKVGQYIHQLKNDFAKDLIKPTKESQVKSPDNKCVTNETAKLSLNQNKDVKQPTVTGKQDASVGVKIGVKTLHLVEEFKCTKCDIYRVFTHPNMISAFSRSQCVVNPDMDSNSQVTDGTHFSMFDCSVTGTFTSVEPGVCVKQTWRHKSWPEAIHSNVTLTFEELSHSTRVTLDQTGIPSFDFERTEVGWKNYYFASIKQTFGFGASLF